MTFLTFCACMSSLRLHRQPDTFVWQTTSSCQIGNPSKTDQRRLVVYHTLHVCFLIPVRIEIEGRHRSQCTAPRIGVKYVCIQYSNCDRVCDNIDSITCQIACVNIEGMLTSPWYSTLGVHFVRHRLTTQYSLMPYVRILNDSATEHNGTTTTNLFCNRSCKQTSKDDSVECVCAAWYVVMTKKIFYTHKYFKYE